MDIIKVSTSSNNGVGGVVISIIEFPTIAIVNFRAQTWRLSFNVIVFFFYTLHPCIVGACFEKR